MRWDVLEGYAKAVRLSRPGRPQPPEYGAMEIDLEQVAAYRQGVCHLGARLHPGGFDEAAFGGLQDTVPRSGLLALHARLEDITPRSWEAPGLAQIWFRWADYLVPRSALGEFTLGAAPRDPETLAALDEFAVAVLGVLSGRTLSVREVAGAFPDLPGGMLLRCLAVTGRIHIRWDASFSGVVPAEAFDVDAEEARLGLARRFLHWFGPADALQFARWAGVPKSDATLTWTLLRDELTAVSVGGVGRHVLTADLAAMQTAALTATVRLLPAGDPYLQLDQGLIVPKAPAELGLSYLQRGGSRSVVNSLGGRVLMDGRIVASWGRKAAKVTVAPWEQLSDAQRERLSAEVSGLARPLGTDPTVSWLD